MGLHLGQPRTLDLPFTCSPCWLLLWRLLRWGGAGRGFGRLSGPCAHVPPSPGCIPAGPQSPDARASVSVDIWSAGCIMAEMITGKILFKGNDRILHLWSQAGVAFPAPVGPGGWGFSYTCGSGGWGVS